MHAVRGIQLPQGTAARAGRLISAMRRLRTSRAPEPDDAALEGFDRLDLEGDAIAPVSDEIASLRPFGSDIPGPVLPVAAADSLPEAELVPRQLDAVLLLRRYLD